MVFAKTFYPYYNYDLVTNLELKLNNTWSVTPDIYILHKYIYIYVLKIQKLMLGTFFFVSVDM